MAGIADSSTVDVVAEDANGVYVLAMVEERPWDASPDQPLQLREKINAYAGFVQDGSLVRHYPGAEGKPLRFQLDCPDEPTEEILTIVNRATTKLAPMGIEFVVNIRGA